MKNRFLQDLASLNSYIKENNNRQQFILQTQLIAPKKLNLENFNWWTRNLGSVAQKVLLNFVHTTWKRDNLMQFCLNVTHTSCTKINWLLAKCLLIWQICFSPQETGLKGGTVHKHRHVTTYGANWVLHGHIKKETWGLQSNSIKVRTFLKEYTIKTCLCDIYLCASGWPDIP